MSRPYIIHEVNNMIILIFIKLSIIFLIHTLWCVIHPQDHTYSGTLFTKVILQIFTLSDTFLFLTYWILIIVLMYTFVTGYGSVQSVDNFRRILGVSNDT
jgi:hypothetical protein